MSDSLTVTTPDGSFQCYVARPAAASAPVIVVVQEIFGINAGIRSIADAYAAQGYLAVAPDMFWRTEPGVQLSEASEADMARAFALYGTLDFDQSAGDVLATVAAARTMDGANGKVGVTGYCFGGLMTFLAAARGDADAYVAYYGGGTDKYAAEGANITKPLLYHLAGDDEWIGADAQATIRAAVAGKPNVEVHTYAGCNHAFARPNGNHYDAAAATLANSRTAAFFKQHLA